MSRTMGRALVLLMIAAALFGPGAPALSGGCCLELIADPDDVDGKLDLAKLRYEKSGAGAPMKVKVRTHEGWGLPTLRDNVNRLRVLIDTDEDGARDYRARIRKVGSELMVFIKGSGDTFEPLPAHKPNRRTVVFTIPGASPANPGGLVDMRAVSRFIEMQSCDPGSGNPACVDTAPDAGWL